MAKMVYQPHINPSAISLGEASLSEPGVSTPGSVRVAEYQNPNVQRPSHPARNLPNSPVVCGVTESRYRVLPRY